MSSFKESQEYFEGSFHSHVFGGNFFSSPTDYTDNGEHVNGVLRTSESAEFVPVTDRVIEKLKQHVQQLEAKLDFAYREIEHLKLQNLAYASARSENRFDTFDEQQAIGRSVSPSTNNCPFYTEYLEGRIEEEQMSSTTAQDRTQEFSAMGFNCSAADNSSHRNSNFSHSPAVPSKKKTSRYWTREEHSRFLKGLAIFGCKDIKSISNYVGTRNSTQVRTHAQKYYQRLARELLKRQGAKSENGKNSLQEKNEESEGNEEDQSISLSSDFSTEELYYDSHSGMQVPKAALEIAKQEAQRLGAKKGLTLKKTNINKLNEADSRGISSCLNSPIYSEGRCAAVEFEDFEPTFREKGTPFKRNRMFEDVSGNSSSRVKYQNLEAGGEREAFPEFEHEPSQGRTASVSPDVPLKTSTFPSFEKEMWSGSTRLDSVVKDLDRWQTTVGDKASHFDEHFAHHESPFSIVQKWNFEQPVSLLSNEKTEKNDLGFCLYSQTELYGDTVASADASFVIQDHGNQQSVGRQYLEFAKKQENGAMHFSHPDSVLNTNGSADMDRVDVEQMFGVSRNTSFQRMFSKPQLSASFSNLGELEDIHSIEQVMFGVNSLEDNCQLKNQS
eukprot:jgi/Galph1/3435/GphlegSOOS_G2113.1